MFAHKKNPLVLIVLLFCKLANCILLWMLTGLTTVIQKNINNREITTANVWVEEWRTACDLIQKAKAATTVEYAVKKKKSHSGCSLSHLLQITVRSTKMCVTTVFQFSWVFTKPSRSSSNLHRATKSDLRPCCYDACCECLENNEAQKKMFCWR